MNSLGYLAPRKVAFFFFFLFTSFKQNTALIKKKRHQNKVFKLSSFIEFPYKCERLKILMFFLPTN